MMSTTPRPVKTVAMYSLKGGTGRTAVTANLGKELVARGCRCLLLDADLQNTLGLHYGMSMGETFGLANRGGSYADFEAYRRRLPSEVPHIPFGRCTPEEILAAQDDRQRDPTWLDTRLSWYTPPDTDLVVIDMPPGFDRWTVRVLREVDLVIVVLLADGASYATTPMVEDLLLQRPEGTLAYLINQLDSRHALSRDVRDSLGDLLGERLLPFVVPYDEAVREALAQQRLLVDHAPESRAVAAIHRLADWLLDRVGVLSGEEKQDGAAVASAAPADGGAR